MTAPIDNLVCDLSNYDADTFDAKAFYAAGVRRAIVGSQQPSLSGQMVDGLRSEGIEIIAIYDLPYFGSDATTQGPITRAVNVATQYKVPMVISDAEIDANQTNVPQWQSIPTPSVSQRQAEFRWGMDLIRRNMPANGVYTNGGWWTPNMGNSVEWADSRLWLATYGVGGSAIAPIESVAFGGWTTVWAHQYTSIYNINGRGRDMSYLFEQVAKEDEMTEDEIKALVAQTVTDLFNAGAPPHFRHYTDIAINPATGGFSDGNGGLLPAVQDQALVARVAALEAREPQQGVAPHTHTPGGVA